MSSQPRLPFQPPPRPSPTAPNRQVLVVGRRTLTVTCVTHTRARHYLLRVADDGGVMVTMPKRGSRTEALRFVREKIDWIERERYRVSLRRVTRGWVTESAVLVRGEAMPVRLSTAEGLAVAHFGGREITLESTARTSIVRAISARLRCEAAEELPRRLRELARQHGYQVVGVTVRDQRSRWGSCSPSGRVSLNWRLAQMPPEVSDYIMLHELAHLRHADHSRRFWREVQRICPWQRAARQWLDEHGGEALSPCAPPVP